MPGGDRTGPMGMGPMSGRKRGYCAGFSVPGYANFIPGYRNAARANRGFQRAYGGFGRGYGRGYGRRFDFYQNAMPEDIQDINEPIKESPQTDLENETKLLKNQSEYLQKKLKTIQDRLDQLEKYM